MFTASNCEVTYGVINYGNNQLVKVNVLKNNNICSNPPTYKVSSEYMIGFLKDRAINKEL